MEFGRGAEVGSVEGGVVVGIGGGLGAGREGGGAGRERVCIGWILGGGEVVEVSFLFLLLLFLLRLRLGGFLGAAGWLEGFLGIAGWAAFAFTWFPLFKAHHYSVSAKDFVSL